MSVDDISSDASDGRAKTTSLENLRKKVDSVISEKIDEKVDAFAKAVGARPYAVDEQRRMNE